MASTLTAKNYSDIVADIVQNLIDRNTDLSDLNSGSIIRSLIEAYALELSDADYNGIYQQIQKVYDSTRVSTATGDDLDEIASIVGIQRKTGVKASVQLTLRRNSPTLSDINILAGSIFSTQIVDGSSLRFYSIQQETFKSNISNEPQEFVSGIYKYKLDERFYDNVSNISGTVSSSAYTFVKDIDWKELKGYTGKLIKQETINEIVVASDAESLTGWSSSTEATALALDNTNFRQGLASFSLGKSGTGSPSFYYENISGTAFDLSGKYINYLFRVADTTTLNNLNNIKIRVGADALNYYEFITQASTLQVGWNEIYLKPSDATIVGTPLLTNLTYVRVEANAINSSTIITNDKLNFDYMIFAEIIDYTGDIIEWIQTGQEPDDGTNFNNSYVPLSKEVVVEAESVGVKYNVAVNKVINKISNLPEISIVNNYEVGINGDDIELDDSLRNRITTSTLAPGKATVSTIQNAVETLDFISSANVSDTPIKVATPEIFTYSTGTDLYQLKHEVAIADSNLKITSISNTLNGAIDDVQTTITLTDSTGFSTTGYVIIDSEVIAYTGITSNDLTGCTRGFGSSIAATHIDTSNVSQWYLLNTDFSITDISEVSWIGTNKPIDAESFTVSYNYSWLGHFEVFVVGPTSFTTAQQNIVDQTIIDYKAAGISYSWSSPVSVILNVSANVNIKTGYSFTNLKSSIEQAIRDKMNSYQIGESVYLSQLIDTIMNVTGVNYVSLVEPIADTIINSNEIAKYGTIVVNEI